MRKNKVGVIVSRIDYGAAEILEVNLALELRKLNYEVFLLPQYSNEKFKDINFQQQVEDKNVKIIRLDFDKPLSFFCKMLTIRKIKLDFVISHNRGGDLLGSCISMFSKTKDIKALHEYYENDIKSSLINKLWALSLRESYFTYHITSHVLYKNRKTFKLKNENSIVVNNAIDFKSKEEPFNLEEFALPKNKKIVLTVARVVKNKGYKNNLEILIPLLKEREDFIYVFAGDNSQDLLLFNEIEQIISENNIKNKVFYLGKIDNVGGLMERSNVLLHYPNHEGFGLVLLEALSFGLPVVASNVGGIPEVLDSTIYKPFALSEVDKARKLISKYLDLEQKEDFDIKKLKNNFSHKKRAEKIAGILDYLK